MSSLIFITSRFPFEPGEAFVEAEFSYLYANFDKVIIVSRNVSARKMRTIPENVKVFRYNPSSSFYEYLLIPNLLLTNFKKILRIYKDEILFRNKIGKTLNLFKKLILIKKLIKAIQLKNFIETIINETQIKDDLTLYSYWMNNGAHAICMLENKNTIKIARAHRIDLYEEETNNKYLPLLKFISDNLDGIFFISIHGKNYYESLLKETNTRNQVSRLGVVNTGPPAFQQEKDDFFRIVSCSSMIPLKRIDLIILSLENLTPEQKLIWYHFGDGELKNKLLELAINKLGRKENIEFNFMGHVSNSELLKFYESNRIDLFLNTSSSEGIPVSIMEAQSFGIPVIATDTGGVIELVKEGTGTLLPIDLKPDQLSETIQYYASLSEDEENEIRTKAFNNWDLNFNAQKNYRDFIIKLNIILASSNK